MITIIAAVAENGIIGDKNQLLWHISEDMRFFRAATTGHPVIMGRKTYESLGRPLPKRRNIVISRQEGLEIAGCEVVHSLEEALAKFDLKSEEPFIIGGAQIYKQGLEVADRMLLTRVHHPYEGDTSFPAWSREEWELHSAEHHASGESYPHPFTFEEWLKK